MKTGENGKNLIKKFEGLRLESYKCPADVWTVGYGTTKDNIKNVKITEGMKITESYANELLEKDLEDFENSVTALVEVELTQNQFDALVSFVYNLGSTAFKGSTLLKLLNEGNYDAAAEQFVRWNKAGGKVLAGLTKRREAERDLFLS